MRWGLPHGSAGSQPHWLVGSAGPPWREGMAAGRLAAGVIAEALRAGDPSRSCLQRYEQDWAKGIGRDMVRNYRLRSRFPPEQRTDERFMRLFALSIGAAK